VRRAENELRLDRSGTGLERIDAHDHGHRMTLPPRNTSRSAAMPTPKTVATKAATDEPSNR